jgi:hypothetical protein
VPLDWAWVLPTEVGDRGLWRVGNAMGGISAAAAHRQLAGIEGAARIRR